MKKINPESVLESFESEIDTLVGFLQRVSNALRGTPSEKADLSRLSESVFISAAVAFEGFFSDLFLAYVNKDSRPFLTSKENEITKAIKEQFGDWYSSKYKIGIVKHLNIKELYPLLDPKGWNITFQNCRGMVSRAKKLLDPQYTAKYRMLSAKERKFCDAVKFIRNHLAHKSDASLSAMNESLFSLECSIPGLGRAGNKTTDVGVFLKTKIDGESRLSVYLEQMVLIARLVVR